MGGGGARPPGAQARQPGAVGMHSSSLGDQKPSEHFKGIPYLDLEKTVLCTRIYFRTAEWKLGADDRKALIDTARTMRTLLVNGARLELHCRGHADVRGTPAFNMDLSARRVGEVEIALRALLDHLKGWSLLPGLPRGEDDSVDSPALWPHDRRVDVFAHVVETEADREEKYNPLAKVRAEIFRRYSPVYNQWPAAGLDYLIDQYELHQPRDYPVEIRPADFEKVLQLTLALAEPSDRGKLLQAATGAQRRAVIEDAYCIEYRRAFDEAYRRYRASPEYGKL